MNSIHCRLLGNFVFLITLFFLLCGSNKAALAQSTPRAQQEFDKLAKAYRSTSISADQYLAKADSLTHQLFSEGQHFETRELAELLELYEKIAWSKEEYRHSRISYFFLFFNNARMFKKRGASMYYAEKVAEEYRKYGQEHSLVEELQKSRIYQELRLYDKVIEIFESEREYLLGLPELLLQDQVDRSIGLNAMYILSPALTGYIRMNDTAAVYQTARLAKQISQTLQQKNPISRSQMLYNDLLAIDIEHSLANFAHRYDSAKILIDRMEALKTEYKDQATNFIDVNLIRWRIENYLELGNPDSLRFYIAKYESSPVFGDGQRAGLHEFKGRLQALEGDYQGAYASLNEALRFERDLQAAVMAESNDLLYAYTQAEHSEITLQKTEQEKQRRTLWLVIISSAATLVVLGIYLLMLRRSRKANEQIETLNNVANMQVIAMEEVKHRAVREEQQRLGQDLHDSLSSSVASVKHQLEVISLDIDNPELKNKLTALQTVVTDVYEATRNKSHEWFYAGSAPHEQSFEQLIRVLTDGALPDSRYKKTIHIDNDSFSHHDMDIKITLLRIIQEAITNIIKHAKATAVEILAYEEMDSLILAIKDDGKGLGDAESGRRSSKMGLQSIRRRIQYLGGDMTIRSDMNGTELTLSIPLIRVS